MNHVLCARNATYLAKLGSDDGMLKKLGRSANIKIYKTIYKNRGTGGSESDFRSVRAPKIAEIALSTTQPALCLIRVTKLICTRS